MPSGSHGGRRGSSSSSRMSGSFSRSSSSRGTSFGGSSRSYGGGFHRHHHGPIRIRFGRRYYVYTGRSSGVLGLLVVLFFFLFFGTLITNMNKNAAKAEIVNLEVEYDYYQNMIDYAKEHTEYQVDAKVTGKFFDDSMDKWYFTYELETANGRGSLEGYTFTHYTTTETYRIVVGQNISVAVDSVPVNYQTDSINMDYDNVALEDIGEYVVAKKSARTSTIVWVVFVILDIAIVAGIGLYIFKKMKKEDEKEVKKEESAPVSDSNVICCKYCGTISDKGTKKCPGCGAGLRK